MACSSRPGTTAPPPAAHSSAPPREEVGHITGPTSSLITPSPPGTRIIYDRKFLMECRNSPVAKTPPKDLPTIPGVTSPSSDEPPMQSSQSHLHSSPEDKRAGGEESQFEMDI
ncbi:Eukaryotic translation initiation factor 4E-binding protein 1 [Apodemus speciosus]|uniref:Eukaryotic translation initiation factor 4E-binding protein 1 n=1 Tax=Apodemus speciosus TaxID=105296 RepID=A0ABQ0F195_APOSI